MFERDVKSTSIQLRVTEAEKEVIQEMARKSPQGDVSTWLMALVANEYKRLEEGGC